MKFEDTATWMAFKELGRVTFAEGALSTKIKELIAIGVAVDERCEGCIRHHIAAALACGAEKAEIAEAISVGANGRRSCHERGKAGLCHAGGAVSHGT